MSYDRNLWNSVKNELKKDKTREEEMKNKTINTEIIKVSSFMEK